MKRKLTQVDLGDGESPPKHYHPATIGTCSNMELPDKYPCLGRPTLSSTPVTSAKPIRLKQQREQTVFDPAAETELRRIVDNFVNIYEQLDKCGGTDVKPNYSYTELAYLAMLRSPNFCLPISEIYSYIQSRFLFFKNSTRKHWRNAVRHSLAKTLCFTKIPVGRGTSNSETLARSVYLWCILPGSIASFARGDYRPGVDKESGTNTLRWGYFQMNAGQFWDQVGNYISHRMTMFRQSLEQSPAPGSVFESQVCNLPGTIQHHVTERPILRQLQNNTHMLPHMNGKDVQYSNQDSRQNFDNSHFGYEMALNAPQFSHASIPHSRNTPMFTDARLPSFGSSPPMLSDPWLPKMTLASPNSSACSVESDRHTPVSLSFDSGNETFDSSPEKSSCRFHSCARLSPPVSGFQSSPQSFNDSGFHQSDLSPLGRIDFSNFINDPLQSFDESKYIPSLPHGIGLNTPMNYAPTAIRYPESSVTHYFPEAPDQYYVPSISYPQTTAACVDSPLPNSLPYVW